MRGPVARVTTVSDTCHESARLARLHGSHGTVPRIRRQEKTGGLDKAPHGVDTGPRMGYKAGETQPKGTCPVCGAIRGLNKDGTVRAHGECDGAGQKPAR